MSAIPSLDEHLTGEAPMRNNVISYVKQNLADFETEEPNEVDALALSWLSYFSLPKQLVCTGAKIGELDDDKLRPDKEMYAASFNPKTSKKLFSFLRQSPRFKNSEIFRFTEDTSTDEEKQFGALCVKLKHDTYFISFRGTDASYVGWKEDFNLAYRFPIPSQKEGLAYVEKIMTAFPEAKFYLGGHSKGGNIAIYAAALLKSELQERIIGVYNFDGPGFPTEFQQSDVYASVSSRIHKYVPNASFVGMLLETQNGFSVVKSGNISFLQHDPFSWAVRGKRFASAARRSSGSVWLERAVNEWIKEMPVCERERVVNIIFSALDELDARDFNAFFRTLYRQIPALSRQYKRLDKEDRAFIGCKFERLKAHMRGKA
ncbi:MAG: DUF2974 domain-containing protein [Clostridia bacterium]|nr:DUF2974 domain-containing protein [Clostridia bacterium]